MHFIKRLAIPYITLILITASPGYSYGQEVSRSEIKASWIYTITDWIEWKTRSKSRINICSMGRDKVYTYLKKIQREEGRDGFIIINKAPNDNLKRCHILYIGDSEQEHYADILEKVINYQGVVTVSSIKGFARRGGTVEFVINKKAYPIINLKSANISKVIIDSKFRGWARTVQ